MKLGKYFFLRCRLNNLVLEVEDELDRPGTPVVTAGARDEEEGNDGQLWWLDHNTQTVRCKLNSYCLTDNDGRIVCSPYVRGKSNQQWVLMEDKIQTQEDFESVIGILDPEDNTGPGASVGIVQYDGHEAQHFKFEHRPAHFFFVRSQENENKIMDVNKAEKKPGTQVICWQDKGNMADNQLWYEDETGTIRSKLTEFAIDTSGKHVVLQPFDKNNRNQMWSINGSYIQNRHDSTQVLEYRPAKLGLGFIAGDWVVKTKHAGTQNQRWLFEPIHGSSASMNHSGNGKIFYVRSEVSGLVLGLDGGNQAMGTPVVTCYKKAANENNTDQLFYHDEATGTIRSCLNNACCFEIQDEKLVINTYDAFNKRQQWRPIGNKIHNCHDQTVVLEGQEGEPLIEGYFDPGKGVTMAKDSGALSQQWEIKHLPARWFYLRSLDTNHVLDVNKDEQSAGAKVITWNQKSPVADNQLWYEDEKGILRSWLTGYVPQADGSGCKMMPYDPQNKDQAWIIVGDRIQNKFKSSLVLDVSGAAKLKGAKIIAHKFSGGNNQKWKKEYV